MANRESQGLQIALILFVMVTVVLAVTTFVFYRSAEEAKKLAIAADAKQKTASDLSQQENFKAQYLMHILGATTLAEAELDVVKANIGAVPEMQAVQQAYDADMSTYGEGLPKEKMNYRELPGHLLLALRTKNQANTNLTAEVDKLNNEKDAISTAEKKRADDALVALQQTKDELSDETSKFQAERARIETARTDELDKFETDRRTMKKQIADTEQVVSQRQEDIAKLEATVSSQRQTIAEMRDEPFEVADGRITWVNQGSSTVWINLGLADGLRRQTLFSVYDLADNGVTRADRKASVEVTKVIDQHLAEARIIFDSPADPILPGDQVFSPAWRPGRKVRFALAGFFYLDGDRRSDRDLIRNLITMSGAVIDAEVHDDGTTEGQLTPSTRYLVRGARPTETSDTKVLTAHRNILDTAEQLGVEVIQIDELLSWMGYKPEVRTVGLGTSADPNQWKIPPAEGKARTSTGNVSGKFRERRPPDRGDDSAYKK